MLTGTFTHPFFIVPAPDAVSRRNNFQFASEAAFQKICPFAAHIRKTNPRDDLIVTFKANIDNRRIMRRGIQFGPELTPEEQKSGKTLKDRGLIFACYQTSINTGFAFVQECKLALERIYPRKLLT